jgi:tetratricopeptide (TPR) repeat protein
MRPRTAFEVMQRLAAIAGIERAEAAGVSRAYLSTPMLVGRDAVMRELRHELTEAFEGRGRSILLQAKAGLGRTRVLDQAVFEAKTAGATVLRARATFANTDGASMLETLAEQMNQALPEVAMKIAQGSNLYATLFEIAHESLETPVQEGAPHVPRLKRLPRDPAAAATHQAAIVRWLLDVGRRHPLVVAVDDVHRLEDGPAATLAALANEAPKRKLLVLATAELGAAPVTPTAFHSLETRSKMVSLEPLGSADTEALMTSLFGDVPNVAILSHTIHEISGGNPRGCLDLAQHLIDTAAVQYSGGTWSLPSHLDTSNLPESADAAIRKRISGLSDAARAVAQAQALVSRGAFSREDYAALCRGAGSTEVDAIITELVENQILVSDGWFYTLAHQGWASSLTESLGTADKIERHRSLAALYEPRPGLEAVRHMLDGGEEARGLERLFELIATVQNSAELREVFKLEAYDTAATFERALRATLELGRPAREVNAMRRWLASLSVASEDSFYWQAAPAWLAQLKHDSGYDAWQAMKDVADPGERRSRALSEAYARYIALPEVERVYKPDEAIRLLVHYVAISIAIGSRTQHVELVASLPPLLEPFAPISPGVDAILHNAMATREARVYAQPEHARRRWIETYERLGKMTPDQVESLHVIRHAIASGIGSVEAQMGLPSATAWAELLEKDQLQQVHSLYLRKTVRLQQGDWDGAERLRRKAEMLEISARARQMFTSSLMIECMAHALASDLTGLKQAIDRIEPLAAKFPGWVPYRHLALGRFEQIRGNFDTARREYETALERATPDAADPSRAIPAFPPAAAGLVETLTALGAHAEALEKGEQALVICAALGIGVTAHEIVRATALADAKLGNFDRAASRLELVIKEQLELGVTGLNLGASYEARARVAIWAGDTAAVEAYGRLTAQEYRHGRGSPLGARYERLMEEAAKGGSGALPGLADIDSGSARSLGPGSSSHDVLVTQAMNGADQARARAQRALRLLCDERKSDGGHLYLFAGDELSHVASLGDNPAPDGLLPFLTKRLEEEQAEDTKTIVPLAGDFLGTDDAAVFTDDAGTMHDPVMLTCILEGKARHAGVAVLSHRRAPVRTTSAALVAAVSAHLIRAGDTEGVLAYG